MLSSYVIHLLNITFLTFPLNLINFSSSFARLFGVCNNDNNNNSMLISIGLPHSPDSAVYALRRHAINRRRVKSAAKSKRQFI